MKGISICIVTYNSLFYNKLAVEQIRKMTPLVDYDIMFYDNGSTDGSVEWLSEQPDVVLIKGSNNSMRHGAALNVLVGYAAYPVVCTLCSDAFPVSPEWIVPALHLSDKVALAGIYRGQRRMLSEYVCPSYLFGRTEWLRNHTFADNWPQWDTAQKLGYDCKQEGFQMKTWMPELVNLGEGYKEQPCDYNGWVWHTWRSTRKVVDAKGVERECEAGYHEHMKNLLRERFKLDY